MNLIILIGRLCADPELKYTPSGTPVCNARIAVNRPKQKDKDQEADFINLVAFKQRAEFMSNYLNKGRLISVEGSLRLRSYVKQNGDKGLSVEVWVNNIEPLDSQKTEGTTSTAGRPAGKTQGTLAGEVADKMGGTVEEEEDFDPFAEDN